MRSFRDTTFLFVSSRSADTLGRVERRWLGVMEALIQQGATVFLICTPKAALEEPARKLGVTIAPYKLDKLNLIRTRSRMRKYLRRYRPALAHSTGYEADILLRWAAKDLPVRVVSSAICGSWPPRGMGAFDSWIRRRLERDSLPRVDAFFADCADLAERVVAFGVPPNRVTLDPPGVSLPRVAREAALPFSAPGGAPLIGYAGALQHSRGLLVLAAAVPALRAVYPDIRVVVAGEGPARARLLPAAADGRIDLLGRVESVPAVLAALDVCVFPVAEEGTPTSLLEAAALGKPIVASAVHGIADLFDDDAEIALVPPGEASVLAEAILGVLADPAKAAAMGERARLRVVDQYSSTAAIERHLGVYRKLIATLQ
ncbi:MAG: glycosyltransferase family 1 protein [Actinobacteria bacterium]|nr:MAG: glycosyltransferase family 1 protein [Actinomycetota bacterium]